MRNALYYFVIFAISLYIVGVIFFFKITIFDESNEKSKRKASEAHIRFFILKVNEFCKQNNRLPSDSEWKSIFQITYNNEISNIRDPWGKNYQYSISNNYIYIFSYGENLRRDEGVNTDDIEGKIDLSNLAGTCLRNTK